ncbi:5584_t:CDS:1, partial [Acaulospora colombiana]
MASREVSKKNFKEQRQNATGSLRSVRQGRGSWAQNQTDLVEDVTVEPTQQIQIMSPVEYLEYVATKEEFSPSAIAAASSSSTTETSLVHTSPLEPTATASSPSTSVMTPKTSLPKIITSPSRLGSLSNVNRSQTAVQSLPLSPLDEVKNQLVDLQTVPSSQMTTEISDSPTSTFVQLPQHQYSSHLYRRPTNRMQPQTSYTSDPDNSTSNEGNTSSNNSSSLIPPGLLLNKNRSRHSTPKLESGPTIQSGYTAQIHRSDSPLRGSETDSQNDSSKYEFRLDYDFIPYIGENYDPNSTYTSSAVPKIPTSTFRLGRYNNSDSLNSQQDVYGQYNNPEPSTSTAAQHQFAQNLSYDIENNDARPIRHDDSSVPSSTSFTYVNRPQFQPQFFSPQLKNDPMLVPHGSIIALSSTEPIFQTEFRLASGDPDDPLLNNCDNEAEEILENVNDEGAGGNEVLEDNNKNSVSIDMENEEEGYEIIDKSEYENLEDRDNQKITEDGSTRAIQLPRDTYVPIIRQRTHHENGDIESQKGSITQEKTTQLQDNATSPVSPVTPNTPDTPDTPDTPSTPLR